MFNKIFVVISLFLASCGTLNYPQQDAIATVSPIIATGLLQFMKYYPSAATYQNLINGSYQW